MKTIVQDIMTTRVVAVRESTPFKEMAVLLRKERVSAFPVVDDEGKVIGIVSETDLLPKETPDARHGAGGPGMSAQILYQRDQQKADSCTAAQLMTSPAVTVGPEESVDHAARLMYLRRVKRLPVVEGDGTLVGIISRADVLSVFDRPDDEIRQEITDDLLMNDFRLDPARLAVTVKDGIVTLEGTPDTESLGHAMVTCARHVQGVVAVRDRLDYPPADLPWDGRGAGHAAGSARA